MVTIGKPKQNKPAAPKQPASQKPVNPNAPKVNLKPASSSKQTLGIILMVVGIILLAYAILTW